MIHNFYSTERIQPVNLELYLQQTRILYIKVK